MVVLSLNLEQQLSGKRFTACALSKSVTAISSQSTVDIYHDNAITSINTSTGPVLYLKVTAQGAVVAASDSMVFLIKNGQVEHRRQLKHIKCVTVSEDKHTFSIFVITEETVLKLDCYLEIIQTNTHSLSSSIKFSRPNYSTCGVLTTNDGTKLKLTAVSSTTGQVDFFSGLGHFGGCQLENSKISQLNFTTFGQPHDQSSCLVAQANHLIVIRGEDLIHTPLISFPHNIIKFAVFERQNVMVVQCENSLIYMLTPDFVVKSKVRIFSHFVKFLLLSESVY